jgi:hypothetical protein
MRFVFHGIGSEYPFLSLAAFVRQSGHEVLEIDMYQNGWRERINNFYLSGSFTLVTSHHPYMDQYRHQMEFGIKADIESTPEFISKWHPNKIFYIPHDIVEPIKDEEIWFVKNFTAILMPDSNWQWLSDKTQVFDIGFIKNISETNADFSDITFLPSEIAFYLRAGWNTFFNSFIEIISLKPRIKFPAFPGTQEFEDKLSAMGCDVVNSTINSSALISRSKIIISNGLSSIVRESSMARVRTICVMDDVHPRREQFALFGSEPFVKLIERQNTTNYIIELLANKFDHPPSQPTKLFDYHRALDIISH